jgi:hypothetical protein
VEDRVIEIVSEQMGVSKDQVLRETSFVNDLGADSLDTVELVMELWDRRSNILNSTLRASDSERWPFFDQVLNCDHIGLVA